MFLFLPVYELIGEVMRAFQRTWFDAKDSNLIIIIIQILLLLY